MTNINYAAGGDTDRQGVGYVNFHNAMWVARTNPILPDGNGAYSVYIGANTDGSPTYGTQTEVTINGQLIGAKGNVSLAVFNGFLYLAYSDGFNAIRLAQSPDGINWTSALAQPGAYCASPAGDPEITAFGANLIVASNSNGQLNVCTVDTSGNVLSSVNTGFSIGFGAGLIQYGSTLFIAMQNASNHNVDLYYSTNGVNFSYSNALASQQTSTNPSFGIHNGVLYVGFRTNDGDHKFIYKYSTNGLSWSGNQDPHYTMGGPPALANADSLTGSPYANALFNAFSANASNHYLYSAHGN